MINNAFTHIVQQQIIEFAINDQQKAADVQERISQVYRVKIMPLLEEVFSSYCKTGEYIRIDQLELNLGSLDLVNLEQDLVAQLKPQLEEKLTQVIYKARQNQAQKGVQIFYEKAKQQKADKQRPKQQRGINLFYFYLERGYFPWWSRSEDRNLEKQIELFTELEWLHGNQKSKLLSLIQNKTTRRRIIDLLLPEQLVKICSEVDPSSTTIISTIQKEVIKYLDLIIDQRYAKSLLAFYSMDTMLKDLFGKKSDFFNKKKKQDYAVQLLLELFKRSHAVFPISKTQLKEINQFSTSDFQFLGKDDFLEIREFLNKETKNISRPFKKGQTPKNKIEDSQKIEINNAGIIILWPYLQIFFRELGLLNGREFKQEAAQWKAIHLLHYLCTGEEKTEEQELILYKLFCQLPIDAFVPTKFELSDMEKEECEHLLETVVKNWPVLKNTSNKGLRDTFLKRAGILSKDDNGWLIQIERKSLDILLDRLNWSISNIKFPWNNYLIKVKW